MAIDKDNTRQTTSIRQMVDVTCDIIIDFRTTNPESDVTTARSILNEFEKLYSIPEVSFQISGIKFIPMGWSVAKLFLSLELAQKLYENNSFEIDATNGRGRSYKFLSWLNNLLNKKGCNAQLNYADDMKNTSGGSKYSSQILAIFSDEFNWTR